MKTTNLNNTAGTAVWTAAGTGIPDVPVNAFVIDPRNSNNLFAGTDIGVYRSTDAGNSWNPYSNGLPRVAVFDMALQDFNRVLRIATHGRGMWEIYPDTVRSSTISLTVGTPSYNGTPSPGFVGNYTIPVSIVNTGLPATAPFYFRVTTLQKNGTDQNPAQPNKLLSADNTLGVVGDLQTLGVPSLATTSPGTAASFLIGIGSRQNFAFFVDFYCTSAGPDGGQPVPIGHYEFFVPDTETAARMAAGEVEPDIGPDTIVLNNAPIITGEGPQSRPSIAIDPTNNNRMAIAANDYNSRSIVVKTSQDGGAHWSSATLGLNIGSTSYYAAVNPSLAYDSFGHLAIVYQLANLGDSTNAIVISSSIDNVNFSAPTAITSHAASEGIIDSRPVIAIAPNNVAHVAWDSYSPVTNKYTINVASGLAGTFGQPVIVDQGQVSAPAIAVSNSGRVYLGWDNWGFNASAPFYNSGGRLMFSSSTDQGATFSAPAVLAATSIGFAHKIPSMPDRGASPDLSLAADPHKDGVIYATFTNSQKGMDIFFTSSLNGGTSWQTIKKINNDVGLADQFNSTISVDVDGSINIAFYDTRLSSTNQAADVYMARSTNGGISFTNQRITNKSSNDSTQNMLRDYTSNLGERIGIAAQGGSIGIVWTDTRNGSEDIFFNLSTGAAH
jgi:hypothetical protein